MSILSSVLQSKGIKRTLAASLAGIGVVLSYFPETIPLSLLAFKAAGYLGAVGVAHAAIAAKS